jgi:hypothetical protein
MSSGTLIVLEIDESTHFWAAACMRTCSSGAGLRVTKWSGQVASPCMSRHICHGVVHDLLLGAGAVGLQHLAGVGIGEDRLDPRGDVAGKQRLIVPVGAIEVSSALRMPCSAMAARTSLVEPCMVPLAR